MLYDILDLKECVKNATILKYHIVDGYYILIAPFAIVIKDYGYGLDDIYFQYQVLDCPKNPEQVGKFETDLFDLSLSRSLEVL